MGPIKIENSIGRKTDPWETTESTLQVDDISPSISTPNVIRLNRKIISKD